MSLNSFAISLTAALVLAACPQPDDDDGAAECDPVAGDAAPVVEIVAPANSVMLDADDAINWVVWVSDEDSDVTEATLAVWDMTDAVGEPVDFVPPSPDADGRSAFSMDQPETLGTGVMPIRIWAYDSIGCEGNDQVVLCIDVDAADCPS